MAGKDKNQTSYDVLNDRAGFGTDTLGFMDAKHLAVASAYDEEFEEFGRFLDVDKSQREEGAEDIYDEMDSLSSVKVDDSEFDNPALNIRKRAKQPKNYRESTKGAWTHINTPDFEFSVHGTRFSGKRGHFTEGADVAVSPGLAVDFTPVTLLSDPVSESVYISENTNEEPVVAYFDKKRGILHNLPTKVLRGRNVSLLASESVFIRSNAPIDMVLDEESGYKLKADGFGLTEEMLYFKNAQIYRQKPEGNGLEQVVGVVELHDAAVYLDEEPWEYKLGLENTEEQKKKAFDKVAKAEKELGLESASDGDTEIVISLEDAEAALEESGNVEEAKSLTGELSFAERRALSDERLRIHPFKRYRQIFLAYNNHQFDANQDEHTDEDGNVDNRVSDDGFFFDYDNPYKLSNLVYAFGFLSMLFGQDAFEASAILNDAYPDNQEKRKALLDEIQDKSVIQMNTFKATQRMVFALKWLKNVVAGNFDKLYPTQEEKLNMGIKPKIFPDANIYSDISAIFDLLPPVLKASIVIAPDFNFTFDWDVFFQPSPNTPTADELKGEAMKAVLPLVDSDSEKHYEEIGETAIDTLLKKVELQTGLRGALLGDASMEFAAKLIANVGLVSADAKLFADISIYGNGKDGAVASAELLQRFALGDYEPGKKGAGTHIGERMLEINFGLGLDASVGTKGELTSPIFPEFSKKLWKTDFASWDIAQLSFSKRFSNATDSGLLGNADTKPIFDASVFEQEVKKVAPKDYGFKLNMSSADTNKILAEGNKEASIDKKLLEQAGVYLNTEDKSTLSIENLEALLLKLEKAESDQTLLAERTAFVHAQNAQNENYQKALKDEDTELHTANAILDKLSGLDKSEKDAINNEYIEELGIKVSEFEEFCDNYIKESVIEELSTPENLRKYETEKMAKEKSYADYNIALVTDSTLDEILEDYSRNEDGEVELDDLNDEEREAEFKEKRRQRLVKKYLKNAKGSDSIESRLTDYANPADLIAYELKAMEKDTADNSKRINIINEKIAELGIDANQASKEFFEFYRDELGGKEYIEHNFTDFISLEQIIDYEKDQLFTDELSNRIYITREYLKNVDLEAPKEDDKAIIEEMRQRLKGLLSEEEVASSLTMTASPEELLEFENRRIESIMLKELNPTAPIFASDEEEKEAKLLAKMDPAEYGHLLMPHPYDMLNDEKKVIFLSKKLHRNFSFERQQRANRNLKNKGGIKKALGVLGAVASGFFYVTDAIRNLADRISDSRFKHVVRENVPLSELLLFEEYIASRDPKGETKEGAIHKNRVRLLRRYIDRADQIKDEELRKEYIDKIRARYFDGTIDISSVAAALTAGELDGEKHENTDFIDALLSKDYVPSDDMYKHLVADLENELKMNMCGMFVKRVNAIEQMIKDKRPQNYIYEKYVRMAGNGLYKGGTAFSESKLETVHSADLGDEPIATIDKLSPQELFRLADNMLREKSMQSFMLRNKKILTNSIKNAVGETVTSMVGADAAVSEEEMLHIAYGGRVEKIERLEGLLKDMNDPNNEQFKGMSEKQKKAYVVKFYRETLSSGIGLRDSILDEEKGMLNHIAKITPELILKFEYKKFEENAKRRQARVDFLKTKKPGDDLSEYRKMVLSDGEGFGAAINKINASLRFNYKTGADKFLNAEDVLTEEDILDFENKRVQRITKKRQDRLAAINQAVADRKEEGNAEILRAYRIASGGAEGFISANKATIEEKIAEKKSTMNRYDMLVKFESFKKDISLQFKEKLTKPVNSLKRQNRTLSNLSVVTKDRKEKLKKLIEELKASAQSTGSSIEAASV